MSLEYRVLGPIEVWADGRKLDVGGARQRRLLGALILADGRPVTADRLVDIVWPGDPPDQARNTLRTYIARARRALEDGGEAPLQTDPNGWRLDRPVDSLDSVRFESLLAAGRALSADPRAALSSLEEALSLWRDRAFVEFRDEEWCAGEAVRLDELRLAAEEERFEAMLGCGLYDDVIGELERFTEHHPLRDRSRGQHMVALYRAGRQVEAVRVYQDYRRYLGEEIGVEPSEELRSLEHRIVERDPTLRQLPPDGRRLRGYQLGPVIGQGTFGRIYRAAQPALGREVAIKVVRPDLADDPEFIRRFDAEARFVARLEHPHVVPLFDYWREPGGAYLVMRYLRGGNARQVLEATGPLAVDRVARLVEEVGGALTAAHAAGVVHRDVKPENILFDDHGSSYLGDFGIAVTARRSAGATPLGGTADVSPEQVGSDPATARSDVYAFGMVLFELLTGRSAHDREPSPVSPDLSQEDLPQELDEVIARATHPDPHRRFASAGDLVVAFRSAIQAEPAARTGIGWAARNPYKGLAAFDEADVHDFFGRDDLIEQLTEQVSNSRFVAVVGPSGCGKSSVLRAGLAPHMRDRGCFVVTMVPGAEPMDALSQALLQIAPAAAVGAMQTALLGDHDDLPHALRHCIPDRRGELLLVVDQFEELFTISDDRSRARFLGAIAAVVSDPSARCRVIATIRADFYDRPLSDGVIGDLVRGNTVAVSPLRPVELERAVVQPAAGVGVTFEPTLVAALVADAAASPSALPLVQYELTDLFERRVDDLIPLDAYVRRGGLGGAIARRADEVYDELGERGRDDVRRLFGRLVAPGERGDDTRRRVRVSELSTVPADLIDAYVEARLLTVDREPRTREPTVEIAHEALIRGWPRLRRWVEADRDGLRTLRHLGASATDWEANHRDAGDLLRGVRLAAAEEWAAGHPGELNPVEQALLDASLSARDVEDRSERRRLRRLRVLVASLAVVAVVAVVAGVVAFRQRGVADDNAAEAERRALENRTAQLVSESALARVGNDPDLAILLALAADDVSTQISDSPQPGVVAALHAATQDSRLEAIIPGGFATVAASPDGGTVALDHHGDEHRLATYDTESGELLEERELDDHIGGLAYSPDGTLLAVTFCCTDRERSEDRPAMLLLDPTSLGTVHELDGGVHSWRPSWSSDGDHVLATGFAGVRVWRVGEAAVEHHVAGTDWASTAAFGSEPRTIVVGAHGSLDVAEIGEDPVVSYEIPSEIAALQVAPTGERVAYIDPASDRAIVLDLETGETVAALHHPSPEHIGFSPDGERLAIGGNSDVVEVIEIGSGEAVELRGHGAGAWDHTFARDGRLLVPMRDGGGTRVWNLSPSGLSGVGNVATGGQVRALQPRGRSELLASVQTGAAEGNIELHDLTDATTRTVATFWFGDFQWPVFSPDGELVVGFSPGERIPTVIEVGTGDAVATLEHCETPRVIDPANRWILVDVDSFCSDPTASPQAAPPRSGFVDLDAGDLIEVADTPARVFEGALGPPGTPAADVVAYQALDPLDRVVFRRASTLELLAAWDVPDGMIPLSSAFSPDGTKLGISAQSREAIVFDVTAILAGTAAADAVTVFPEMHSGPTQRVIPVGNRIVTTGGGDQVRQWDAASGDLLVDLSTEAGGFVQMVALPDGATVYYADADGLLRRLLVDPDDVVELARSRVQREFTPAECGRYFPAGECPTADIAVVTG